MNVAGVISHVGISTGTGRRVSPHIAGRRRGWSSNRNPVRSVVRFIHNLDPGSISILLHVAIDGVHIRGTEAAVVVNDVVIALSKSVNELLRNEVEAGRWLIARSVQVHWHYSSAA